MKIHSLEEKSEGRVLIPEVETNSCGTDKEKEKKLKQKKKKALKKKDRKLNDITGKAKKSQSEFRKKNERSLSHIEGYKEFNLKSDVKSWKNDSRNK